MGPFASLLRRIVLDIRSALVLPWGLWRYKVTGRTPEFAYQAMIWLFCTTGGRFNDWMSNWIARQRPPLELPSTLGFLGHMNEGRRAQLVEQLRRDGVVVFPSAIPQEICGRLLQFTREKPGKIRAMDGQPVSVQRLAIINTEQPEAVRYDYLQSDLLNLPDVQELMADASLLALVQDYLGCAPISDVLSMWWHTAYKDHPDSMAAQYFHFDMDRLKWLKVFIYITDVGQDNGPHSFVRGSHRTGAIPIDILRRGYVRLTDEEVKNVFSAEDILVFNAPRGTIIVEDTRGLHKGIHVREGARLILQLQFSNTLFGSNYPRVRINKIISSNIKRMIKFAPGIYRQYI